MSGFGVDPLLEERWSREHAGGLDHIDQDTRDEDAATEPEPTPEPQSVPLCTVQVGRVPRRAGLRGFVPVRCRAPLPCPTHGGER